MTPKALLLDIEGTTTPIEFVYQTLFPYARTHMAKYLEAAFEQADRALLFAEHAAETDPSVPTWTEPPVSYLLWLMGQDRKSRGLKSIQGKVWEQGYRNGSLRAELFPDVAPAMLRWKFSGRGIYIYSSGSVHAQRLLFGHTTEGDLTPWIDGYFDTEAGGKREPESYRQIAGEIGVEPAEILFVTDVAEEAAAARAAGLRVCLSIRPGNAQQDGHFPRVTSLEQLTGGNEPLEAEDVDRHMEP